MPGSNAHRAIAVIVCLVGVASGSYVLNLVLSLVVPAHNKRPALTNGVEMAQPDVGKEEERTRLKSLQEVLDDVAQSDLEKEEVEQQAAEQPQLSQPERRSLSEEERIEFTKRIADSLRSAQWSSTEKYRSALGLRLAFEELDRMASDIRAFTASGEREDVGELQGEYTEKRFQLENRIFEALVSDDWSIVDEHTFHLLPDTAK